LGRSIRTRYVMAATAKDTPEPAPYPIQRNLTKAMRDDAVKKNNIDGMQAWAGQSAKLASPISAEQIVINLWEGAQKLL